MHELLHRAQVIGNANKHIARVAKFLTKYGELALFPVKLQARPSPESTFCCPPGGHTTKLLVWCPGMG